MASSEHNSKRRAWETPVPWVIVPYLGALTSTALLIALLFGAAPPISAQTSEPQRQLSLDAATAVTVQLHGLLADGDFEAAYRLASSAEDVESGSPDFDYLYGLAALESGRAAEATLAFERVLALKPDFLGAQLDMARAQAQLGQLEQARASLLELKAQNPPPQAEAAIDEYLEAIDSRRSDTRLSAFVEAGAGYNSNVANATSNTSVFLPVLQAEFALSGSSVAQGDGFAYGAGGARWEQKITRGLDVTVAGDVRGRVHKSEGDFDEISPSITGALRYKSGYNAFQVFARNERLDLDYEQYRNTLSLGLAYIREIDQDLNALGFVQHSRIRFDNETNSSSDSNVFIVGAGVSKRFGDKRSTKVSANIYAGRDNDTRVRADGDSRLLGIRLGAEHTLAPNLLGRAVVSAQINQFDETNLLFQRKRTDRYFEAEAAVRWHFLPRWSLLPSVKWSRNVSNLPLNDTRRFEALLKVRRDLF